MFKISKYKDSNVKLSVRLPENLDSLIRIIAQKESMSYNNVLVSCVKYALSHADLSEYLHPDELDNYLPLLTEHRLASNHHDHKHS